MAASFSNYSGIQFPATFQQRLDTGMGMLDTEAGWQKQRLEDLAGRYRGYRSRDLDALVTRGLTGSSNLGSTERYHDDLAEAAQRRHEEGLLDRRLGTYSQLSGEKANAEMNQALSDAQLRLGWAQMQAQQRASAGQLSLGYSQLNAQQASSRQPSNVPSYASPVQQIAASRPNPGSYSALSQNRSVQRMMGTRRGFVGRTV